MNSNELARRTGERITMRETPLRFRVRTTDLLTADVHLVDLVFGCSALALDRRGEREMFTETFLSNRDVVTADDVAAHFTPALKQAAAALVATEPAEHWLVEGNRTAIINALSETARRLAFACGVELLPPFELAVSSPSLEREKLEATGRKLSERRTAGQVAHVQQATALLTQFETLRQSMPGLSPGQLLGRVGDADRGSMLQSLLMASASGATATLWAVAGPNLIRIDPRTSPVKVSVIALPTDLGPLRSVQAGDGKLLVGAQAGIIIVDPNNVNAAVKLRDPQVSSQLGFNSVAATRAVIWASHSQAGVVAWRASEPDAPVKTIRDAVGARNLVTLDDSRVIYDCNVGVCVDGLDGSSAGTEVPTTLGAIVLIDVDRQRIVLVHTTGDVETLDRETLQRTNLHRRAGEITSAGVLPWLGSTRLLLATSDGPIVCVGDDDPLVTHYASPHRGLRAVAACADVVAAFSADRQRIILWNSWVGDSPTAEINVATIARHRAADLCFA